MSTDARWRLANRQFFADRARMVSGVVSLDKLCFVSGRDPRLWTRQGLFDDLIESVLALCKADASSTVIEVGCASGFLAWGLAPRVRSYTGIDVARSTLRIARRLRLNNAVFRHAKGERLPFADSSFDCALCYDVFTNFPSFGDGRSIIEELVRVVRPGGRALIGSIPDSAVREAYEERVQRVAKMLDEVAGPAQDPSARAGVSTRTLSVLRKLVTRTTPDIGCYYFNKVDFVTLGEQLGVTTQIVDIHSLNPYVGLRFNVIYMKP